MVETLPDSVEPEPGAMVVRGVETGTLMTADDGTMLDETGLAITEEGWPLGKVPL